jgi:hypothetical protein
MNHQIFNINFTENEVFVTHCPDQRKFTNTMDIEFTTHGFKKLNGKTIIKEKLEAWDFTYTISPYSLTLKFKVTYGSKSTHYSMCLLEFFEEIKISNEIVLLPELTNTLWALINKVNNLSARLDDKEAEVARLNTTIFQLKFDLSQKANMQEY